MTNICEEFSLSNLEWTELEKKFDGLALFAGWQLLRMNARNNHTSDIEDIAQDLRWAICRAACYHKRQVYIRSCFVAVNKYVQDLFLKEIVKELEHLWANKTRHGAGRVTYGEYQQEILEQIMREVVPEKEMPDKNKSLSIDTEFITYCKPIVWNEKKSLGKKITREKSWRTGLVSLSEHDHLQSA